jgi:hypothetical protein
MTCILITRRRGFISANFVLDRLAARDEPVVNFDKLSYAGNTETLASLQGDDRIQLVTVDFCDSSLVSHFWPNTGSVRWSTSLSKAMCPPSRFTARFSMAVRTSPRLANLELVQHDRA